MDQNNPPLEDDDMQYTPASHPQQFGAHQKKGPKWPLLITLGIVLLVGLGAGAYFLFFKNDEPAKQATQTRTQATNNPSDSATDLNEPQADATEKSFKSDKLGLEFTYRSDWTMKESTDKAQITLTSPRTAVTTKDGQAAQGVFTVKLRHGSIPEAMQTNAQKAIAVKDSVVIAYAHPTEQQRQYTNVSYGGPDAETFSFFVVSGSNEYKKGQLFGAQLSLLGDAYLFVGGYGADTNDTLEFDQVPAASFDSDAYQQAQKIIESLKIY